jgi:transposase
MKAILGMDVGSEVCQARLLRGEQEAEDIRFDNKPQGLKKLRRFLKQRHIKTLHVCMEASGRYYEALADFLYAAGYAVSVVNPARIKAYADSRLSRNKTDLLDAAAPRMAGAASAGASPGGFADRFPAHAQPPTRLAPFGASLPDRAGKCRTTTGLVAHPNPAG